MTHAVVLFGHGSRDPAWRQPMDAVARRIVARQPEVQVACAFLELQEPSLPAALDELVARGVRSVRVVPMFLGAGRHAREDLPVLLNQIRSRHPGLALEVTEAVGEQPEVLDLLAQLALRTLR
ncbi:MULTISPECIES: sirohydrochlorin chelatase [Ramlibacter]|uniref:Cobalamin biosynthesis protein CbiX n=1 Tax=Ramlibacter pinisoli TaxID=2682844 RepID=A0A6N8IV50_9BURK|nr:MULTISPECIES: CbiX/SirB N-terminal domain-containing protein [Ramlibacter]MBA2960867.1 CbiX/SirB N-terminal domain-containing protein [Ramlibacter sp. CGMCC 1.13660]MVQ30814.1 cobalamin biosynthesis protein CbiX [Ramlibacter pinisoli]